MMLRYLRHVGVAFQPFLRFYNDGKRRDRRAQEEVVSTLLEILLGRWMAQSPYTRRGRIVSTLLEILPPGEEVSSTRADPM